MVSPTAHSETFYSALAAMAETLRQTILALVDGERARYVQRRVANSEIVFGVWPDPQGAGGFGFHLIKGRGHLTALLGELPDESTTTAIPCVGLEQAISAGRLWGEPSLKTNSSEFSPFGKRKKAKPQPRKKTASKDSAVRPKRAPQTRH